MISARDKAILRELAARQAEIAALPVMKEREKWWYDLNDGKTTHPLVTFEFNGPREEIYPDCRCEGSLAREIEYQLITNLTDYRLADDDRVIPGCVWVRVRNGFTPFGREVQQRHATYSDGRSSMGYQDIHPVQDFERDRAAFGPSTYTVDEGLVRTAADAAQVREAIGDLLEVNMQFRPVTFYPAAWVLGMMGMESMLIALYDDPDGFHEVMGRLTDDMMAYMDKIQATGAMLLNGDGSFLNQGSWGYTHDLPRPGFDGHITFGDVWGYSNSQETVSVSPAMYDEFFFTYIERFAKRFGLFAYGCCEPVDTIWEGSLSRLKNLRKLSVSPWCNEEKIGEYIRGKKIVYHRKPSPNFIGVDDVFDEQAFAQHMKRTVLAARGCPLEVTFRDVLTLKGEPQRMHRAVEIVREAFDRYYQG
nr:hypothetical protein [bacterium]